MVGATAVSDIQKRIHDHIKRVARDGDDYEKTVARLSWASRSTASPTDVRDVFLSAWKQKIIGITGAYGKTTTAVWAAHLIGDAVVAGHIPGRPLLPALDSRARIAVIVLEGPVSAHARLSLVSTDGVSNLDAAKKAARMAGVSDALIEQRVATLPQISLRQEVIHESPKLTVVNDAMATQPAHGIAALERWGGPTCILICGGDGNTKGYQQWARVLPTRIRKTNLIFLTGTATKGMRVSLGEMGRGVRAYDSLAAAVRAARARAGLYVKSVILFSPAAKPEPLFESAYDRGQQFNALIG